MIKPSSKQAISILSKLLELTSAEALAFFVAPNIILTLSGTRALCDGIFYHKDDLVLQKWAEEINRYMELIGSISNIYSSNCQKDISNSGKNCVVFDMILVDGLEYALSNTQLITKTDAYKLILNKINASQLFDALCSLLIKNKKLNEFSAEDIKHISSGILLGYPDKAILGSVKNRHQTNPFIEPLIGADIRGAGYYICPQPVYSYPRNLLNNAQITTHEQLWSKILRDYYTSDFHKNLESNQKFMLKCEQLGMLNF